MGKLKAVVLISAIVWSGIANAQSASSWAIGLGAAGNAMAPFLLQQAEQEHQNRLMREQHALEMQRIEREHELRMQAIREQQEAQRRSAPTPIAPTYTTTDAQKSFTAGVAAYRAGDFVNAVHEFRSAAAAGFAPAQTNLGFMYASGQGSLSKNEVEAVRLYGLAASQGNATAQINLAGMYASGRGGLPKDEVEAARLIRLAANQGNSTGQYLLGSGYEKGGGGLAKDIETAISWYRLAGQQGQPQAIASLKRLGRQ